MLCRVVLALHKCWINLIKQLQIKHPPSFCQIFRRSLELFKIPSCFKFQIPVSKETPITGLNDYRPVALISVVMKSFERLMLAHLKDTTEHLPDPLQFANWANRGEQLGGEHAQKGGDKNGLQNTPPYIAPTHSICQAGGNCALKFLGTTISCNIKWEANTNTIPIKDQ